jgi:excisionase family DNA binding protein
MSSRLANLRAALEAAASEVPAADLADAIGLCASAQARMLARLTAPPPASTDAAEWVTAEEVAQRFHLALSSVHELARQGRLPHQMFGRYRRFNLAIVASAVAEPASNSKTISLGAGSGRRKAA